MKIRITESQLKKLIRESIYEVGDVEEPAMGEPTEKKQKKKILNKTRNVGTYKQTYQGDPYKYLNNIPGFAIIISKVKDSSMFNHLMDMVTSSPVGDYYMKLIQNTPELLNFFKYSWEQPEIGKFLTKAGFRHYRDLLIGTYNQIYKSDKFADSLNGAVRLSKEEDPIKTTYLPRSEKCPFMFQNGVVRAKDNNFIGQYFERYDASDAIYWDLATYHEKDNSFIFFFWDLSARNNFTKQLKNMFMIASHIFDKKTDLFYYTFIQSDSFNPQIKINQAGGGSEEPNTWACENPRNLLDPEEDEGILALLSKLEEIQQKDEEQRQLELSPEYLAQKAKEEEEEKYRRASQVIDAHGPSFLSPSPSLARNNGGTVDESTLARMIKESIIKVLNKRK